MAPIGQINAKVAYNGRSRLLVAHASKCEYAIIGMCPVLSSNLANNNHWMLLVLVGTIHMWHAPLSVGGLLCNYSCVV